MYRYGSTIAVPKYVSVTGRIGGGEPSPPAPSNAAANTRATYRKEPDRKCMGLAFLAERGRDLLRAAAVELADGYVLN